MKNAVNKVMEIIQDDPNYVIYLKTSEDERIGRIRMSFRTENLKTPIFDLYIEENPENENSAILTLKSSELSTSQLLLESKFLNVFDHINSDIHFGKLIAEDKGLYYQYTTMFDGTNLDQHRLELILFIVEYAGLENLFTELKKDVPTL